MLVTGDTLKGRGGVQKVAGSMVYANFSTVWRPPLVSADGRLATVGLFSARVGQVFEVMQIGNGIGKACANVKFCDGTTAWVPLCGVTITSGRLRDVPRVQHNHVGYGV